MDQEAFKVLASETRIGILKELDKNQMTVSDLARSLDMSKATLFEHLEKLIKASLIKKKVGERKWVYYKLTWKGKNILHPERTRIAIVLTVFVFALIIIGIIGIISIGYDIFNSKSKEIDIVAPKIYFTNMEDITENTISPDEIIIEIYENKKIDESSLKLEYTILENYIQESELLSGWQELEGTFKQGKVSANLPKINWSNYSGKYLYIRCTIFDKTGNSAENIYVEYIEEIYNDSFDLSITISDVVFSDNYKSIRQEGNQVIPIKVKIHNTGSIDVQNIEVSIFVNNPDKNNDGYIDNLTNSIKTQNIDVIQNGEVKIIEMDLELNLSRLNYFWVAIDPSNVVNESNELNNIIKVNLNWYLKESVIPEFPIYSGIFVILSIILIHAFFKKKDLGKKPGDRVSNKLRNFKC